MLISIAFTLISLFQQSDSAVTYSMPVDKNGRIASLQLFSDSTFSFYARSYEVKSKSEWFTIHTTLNGTSLKSGSKIVFEFTGQETRKYKFITHSAPNGFERKKISGSQVCSVKTYGNREFIQFSLSGDTYPMSRSKFVDSSLAGFTGYFTTELPATMDQSTNNETKSVYSLYLAPCAFYNSFGQGHFFCLEFSYHDFEGGSMLCNIEGTYTMCDGKLRLTSVVNAEQNDAPLSGMTKKSLTFTQEVIEIEWNGSSGNEILLNRSGIHQLFIKKR